MQQHFSLYTISSQVGIDLIGPLPKTDNGNCYIVTLVDFFSKWPEAEPLRDKSAKSVSLFLYKMICRYWVCVINVTLECNPAASLYYVHFLGPCTGSF